MSYSIIIIIAAIVSVITFSMKLGCAFVDKLTRARNKK